MTRRVAGWALLASLLVLGGRGLAQEHGAPVPGEEAVAPGAHGAGPAVEGFMAPHQPFNLFDPSGTREVRHGRHVLHLEQPPPFVGPLFNFGILLVLGYMAVKRGINPALSARRAALETELNEARELRARAETQQLELGQRLATIDSEIEKLRAEFVRMGEAERDRIVAEAKTRAERLRVEGAQMIEQEIKALREELRSETLLAAVAAAEDAIRKAVSAGDQQRLADQYLQGMETEAARPGAQA